MSVNQLGGATCCAHSAQRHKTCVCKTFPTKSCGFTGSPHTAANPQCLGQGGVWVLRSILQHENRSSEYCGLGRNSIVYCVWQRGSHPGHIIKINRPISASFSWSGGAELVRGRNVTFNDLVIIIIPRGSQLMGGQPWEPWEPGLGLIYIANQRIWLAIYLVVSSIQYVVSDVLSLKATVYRSVSTGPKPSCHTVWCRSILLIPRPFYHL
jgi:hypothetical protein